MLISDDLRYELNDYFEFLGMGPCMQIALSPSGKAPETHWICQIQEKEGFAERFKAVPDGAPEGTKDILANMESKGWISVEERFDCAAHQEEVQAAHSLQLIDVWDDI